MSEFKRNRTINESIGPLADHWDGKEVREEREEIESFHWLIKLSNESEYKRSSPIKK